MPRKTRRKHGGGKIGEGLTGKVYYPALSCKDPAHNPTGDYVSKKVIKAVADREMAIAKKLEGVDYAIYPIGVCEHADGSYLLFSKYGGQWLSDYFSKFESIAYKRVAEEPGDKELITDTINAMKTLLTAVTNDLNHTREISHNDISFDNVLYNHDEKKAYLIDFERSGPRGEKDFRDQRALEAMISDFEEFKAKFDSAKKAGTRSRRSKSKSKLRGVKQWGKTYERQLSK